ncbi:hypothetical protein CEXT_730391 [Caerostris extrusa]|uniref:Uncharacterized protein n=1 Tax=Caerostris extrusa TaxID=172846 RepID=A0AAV4ND65_CAEEX|nr:hypothetical protein CEXT_730391 [Caerostris extrusa]
MRTFVRNHATPGIDRTQVMQMLSLQKKATWEPVLSTMLRFKRRKDDLSFLTPRNVGASGLFLDNGHSHAPFSSSFSLRSNIRNRVLFLRFFSHHNNVQLKVLFR